MRIHPDAQPASHQDYDLPAHRGILNQVVHILVYYVQSDPDTLYLHLVMTQPDWTGMKSSSTEVVAGASPLTAFSHKGRCDAKIG